MCAAGGQPGKMDLLVKRLLQKHWDLNFIHGPWQQVSITPGPGTLRQEIAGAQWPPGLVKTENPTYSEGWPVSKSTEDSDFKKNPKSTSGLCMYVHVHIYIYDTCVHKHTCKAQIL